MIYVDASRYSNTKKRTGVENYSYHLINELVKRHGKKITLISPRKVDLPVTQIIIPFPRLWTLVRLSWEILRNREIDNLFVPSHVLPIVHTKKATITIHDVVFKYSPKSYSSRSRLYLDWAAKFAVKNAAKIIAPSEATKKDLIRFYRADRKKINVVPLGYERVKTANTFAEHSRILKKHKLNRKKYFLFLGRIEYKKNSDTLIKAFLEFAKKDPDIKLVLAGFTGYGGGQILSDSKAAKNNRIVMTGYVADKEKEALMKNALCFIFPSRFEGFGLPLLEAMDAKLPIIASDIPTSREIAGSSVSYFPTEDTKALTRLMHQAVKREKLSKKASEQYKEILKKHTWRNCSEKVYRLLLGPSA